MTTLITAGYYFGRYYANISFKTKKMELCLCYPRLHVNAMRSNARPRKRKDLDNFSPLRISHEPEDNREYSYVVNQPYFHVF